VQANLQEGRHALARKIFHGRAGQLYQRYQDGTEGQTGALGLVLIALVLLNTRYMDAAVTQLRDDGFDIRDEDVARLSPFVRHINVFGRYSFQLPDLPGGPRPLRDKDAIDEEWRALARTAGQDDVRRCGQCAARLPEGSRRSRRYCSAACRVGRCCEGGGRPRSGRPKLLSAVRPPAGRPPAPPNRAD
jgi:hypothetical protein